MAKIGGEETRAAKRSRESGVEEGQVARQTALTVVPAVAVYRPSPADAVPRGVTQRVTLVTGARYVPETETVTRPI